ncbi:hypothetical protein ACT6QE_07540, partial [Staphylococcus aureus]
AKKLQVFNRVLCPSYQGFRIYRETLSRFSCASVEKLFNQTFIFSSVYCRFVDASSQILFCLNT